MRRFMVGMMCLMLMLAALPVLAQDAGVAYVRIGHFSPGFGEVDVYINGELSDAQMMSFGELSEWIEIAPGSYPVAVTPAGASLDEAAVSGVLTLTADQRVTEMVIGQEPRGTAALHPVVEDYSEVGYEETRITFFNAIPDMGPVNVYLADGTLLVDTLLYPELGSTDEDAADGYATLDLLAGNRTVQVIPVGSDAALVSMENAELASGKSTLVVIAGLQANPLVTWVSTEVDSGEAEVAEAVEVGDGSAMVRVAHFISGAPEAVDIYINGALSEYVGLTLGDVSEWVEMPAGYYDMAVAPTGTSLADAILVTDGVPVVTDQYTTLAAIGAVELGDGLVYPLVENYDPITYGETRIAFFHAVQDLEPANVQLADGTTLMMTVGYPGLPGVISYDSADIVAGLRDVQVVSSVDPSVVLSDLPATQLTADSNNLIVVTGLRNAPVTFHLVTAQD